MRFSIIIPVLNDAAILEQQLLQLRQDCAHYDWELVIVDGGSSDATCEIGQRYGKVIKTQRRRAIQMNAGAKAAQGDILLFLYADTSLPRNALALIEQYLHINEVVGGAFHLRYDRGSLVHRLVAFTTNMRSRLFKVFTGEQAYFIRASTFKAIGGYPEQALLEDLEITRLLRKNGTFVLLHQPVTNLAHRHSQVGLLQSIFLIWYMRLLNKFGVPLLRLQQMCEEVR